MHERFFLFRFIGDKEIEPSDKIHMDFNEVDKTYTLTIDDATPEMQGPIKAVAANTGGDVLTTANLEVRGRAPTFKQVPLKCTLLEGKLKDIDCHWSDCKNMLPRRVVDKIMTPIQSLVPITCWALCSNNSHCCP